MNLDGRWDNENSSQSDQESNLKEDITGKENRVKTFTVKNYIPKRSTNNKFLELPYIVGVVLIFILTVIIIILISRSSKRAVCDWPKWIATHEVSLNVSGELIMLDKNQFFIYDPRRANLKLFLEVKNPAQSFDFVGSTLFWIEANSSNIMSLNLPVNKSEKDVNLIFDEARTKPCALALDSFTNNLYIVDDSIPGIIVFNLDTKYWALLLINLIGLRYIELDVEHEIMFIGSTKEIKRADMDSKNLMSIVNSTAIDSITLDREEEQIYWISNYKIIERCDYFGQFVEKIVVDPAPILDLTILNGYLFWLRKPKESQETVLWSCKIQNGVCDDHERRSNAANSSVLISVPSHTQQNTRHQYTWTEEKCEHISLATPSGPMTCVCNMSSQLMSSKTCGPAPHFLLYTLNNVTRTYNLYERQGIVVEPFWPTPYRGNLSFKGEIDFDYDFENGDFYFSDDKIIYKIKLTAKSPQQEIVLTSDDMYIKDIAFDWLTGNMYYIKCSNDSTGKLLLSVFNVKKGQRIEKVLKNFDYNNHFGMNATKYGLASYPSRGTIFFAVAEKNRMFIYQIATNGSEIFKFNNEQRGNTYRPFAIDYYADTIYWISSDWSVEVANFENHSSGYIRLILHAYPKTISISEEWMYLSDLTSVYRMNKHNGRKYTRISPLTDNSLKVAGVRIINQSQVIGNLCKINNGGCEQFCYYGKNATCDCAEGFTVTSKGACE